MRIVSYNILDGGVGRADPLAEVILAQRPDIVVLVEADNADVLERLARRLNMDAIRGEGTEHSAAILSRWPIVSSINHAAIRPGVRCLLEAVIREPVRGSIPSPGTPDFGELSRTGEGRMRVQSQSPTTATPPKSAGEGTGTTAPREWIIAATHLHPRAFEADEQVREKEVAEILEIFAPHRRAGRPHILAGDFNANSPIQNIDPSQCTQKTRQAWEANGGQIPRRAIQRLLDAGYVDAIAQSNGPAAATMTTFTTQHPGQRLDYIFTHGIEAGRIKSGWVEKDRLAKYGSDHFPIGAEVE